MKLSANRKNYYSYLFMVLGIICMALSINNIYEPMEMVTGGFTGLAIVIKYYSEYIIEGGIPLWFTNIVLNIPLFIAAVIIKGWMFVARTCFATTCLSLALYLIPNFNIVSEDYLLASVFGGLIGGLGIGLILLSSSTTGGTDLLAVIIQKFMRHYSIAKIIVILDGIIVISGAVVFGIDKALYAMIAVYITAKVTDTIIEGMKFAKLALIISDNNDAISEMILNELNRGVTALHATGMYSNQNKKMLMCVVSKKEIIKLTDIVHKIDKKAFVTVSDVREVLGEGFIEYKQ